MLLGITGEAVTACTHMFRNCTNLVDIGDINLPNCTEGRYAFLQCSNLTNIGHMQFGANANIRYMFSLTGLTELVNQNLSDYKDIYMMFESSNMSHINNITVSNITSSVAAVFSNCKNLRTLSNMSAYNLVRASGWFENCTNLTSVSNLVYDNVSNLVLTFKDCYNLVDVDIAPMPDTLLNINNMFENCTNLSANSYANIANFLPNATNLTNKYLEYIGLNVSNFTNDQINILNTKGYVDAIIPGPTAQTYYHIEWD